MLEVIGFGYFSKFIWGILWAITTDDNFWYSKLWKDVFESFGDAAGSGAIERLYFWISGEVVYHCKVHFTLY